MRSRKLATLFLLLLTAGLTLGCTGVNKLRQEVQEQIQAKQDPVAADLIRYSEFYASFTEQEEPILTYYNTEVVEKAKTNAEAYQMMKDKVIPEYWALKEQVNKYKPETPELQKVHQMFKDGTHKQFLALQKQRQAFEYGIDDYGHEAADMFDTAWKQLESFSEALVTLSAEHGVDINQLVKEHRQKEPQGS